MNHGPTLEYVQRLESLKNGHRKLLRSWALARLHCDVEAFDIFAGLWWPLRQRSPRAPRREVAWLAAKLYGAFPLPHAEGHALPRELSLIRLRAGSERDCLALERRFDALLASELQAIEPHLRWALATIQAKAHGAAYLDWVDLIDTLSRWETRRAREQWAELFERTLGSTTQETHQIIEKGD